MHGVIIETGFKMLKLVWAVEHLVVQIKAEELSASCHNYIVVSTRYSKEHLKIHTVVPSLLALLPPPPAFPSLSCFPPFLYPLPLEVGPLKSS